MDFCFLEAKKTAALWKRTTHPEVEWAVAQLESLKASGSEGVAE